MSVNATKYVIYGIKGDFNMFYPKNESDSESVGAKYLIDVKDNPENGDAIFISDGMNGEYSVFGILVDQEGDFDDFNLALSSNEIDKLDDKFYEVASENKIELGDFYNSKLYILTHYTWL